MESRKANEVQCLDLHHIGSLISVDWNALAHQLSIESVDKISILAQAGLKIARDRLVLLHGRLGLCTTF